MKRTFITINSSKEFNETHYKKFKENNKNASKKIRKLIQEDNAKNTENN